MIGMTAFGDVSVVPTTIQSALIPSTSTHYLFKESMTSTFWGRIQNYILNTIVRLLQEIYVDTKMDEMVRKAVDGKYQVLPVKQLRQRATLVLINYNEVIDGLVQLPSNVIGVGGLQIQEPKQLSMDFAHIANNATNGLILFSLGTNVKSETLGDTKILQILNAFERLPAYTFLWKIDLFDISIRVPPNVYIRKWIPQNDVLGHENTKLFITHGGLLSTQEAIFNSIPILGIPIMVDQFMVRQTTEFTFQISNTLPLLIFKNIDRCVERGIAGRINVKAITSDNLYEKLNEMLSNPMYKENCRIASQSFRDQKERPLDRAIWWIEWALRNPNSVALNRGKNLNFIQLQSIDVIGVCTVATLVVIYVVWVLLKIFFTCVCRRRKIGNKEKRE